jgi:hypothetical protein
VHPEPNRQSVRTFDNLPKKTNNNLTVKAHADGSQIAMEFGPFSWRSAPAEPIGDTNKLPAVDDPHSPKEGTP